MKTITYILQKEFIQILRHRTMLAMIIVMPFVQLLILVNAATFDMKNIDIYVVDRDQSSTSRQLVNKFEASPFYKITARSFSVKEGMDRILKDKADLILQIPDHFEHNLRTEDQADIQLLINAINGNAAGLINAYSSRIISDYNHNIAIKWSNQPQMAGNQPVEIVYSFWYNPEMNYKIYMVPGILVILVTIISLFLTAMNIVREKEMGTIEQINVTPIKKYQFIIGKLLPFLIIALFELAFGLFLGRLIFNVPIVGNLPLLFGFAIIYLLVILGFGLFLSVISENQQQVMFVTFFFMLVFILMSGIFTPTESMPDWANKVNVINPIAYFMRVIRMILLKGSGFRDILPEFYSLLLYAFVSLGLAVWRYRKTT
ncbi:MAG: ABC transporter permease [Bacteroidota bacterium]